MTEKAKRERDSFYYATVSAEAIGVFVESWLSLTGTNKCARKVRQWRQKSH